MGGIKYRYDLISIVVVFLMAILLEYSEAFSLIEDETLSYRQILRTHFGDEHYTSPTEEVLIVHTDEEFYEEYGVFPLRRVDLATIIERLADMGAAVIGVDILLDFNSAYGEDPMLEDALERAGNVVLVSQAQFEDDEFVGVNRAIDRFEKHTDSGYSNVSSNSAIAQSIVRLRVYPEIGEQADEWPFAAVVVGNFLDAEPGYEDGSLWIGDEIEVPLDQFNDLYIDYPLLPDHGTGQLVNLHDVVGLSAIDLLFAHDEELEDLSFLVQDKIVLIGEVAEVAHDEFETPVGNVFGVEIIADTISTILHGGPLQAASLGTEILFALIIMAALMATSLINNPLPRNLTSAGIVVLFILIACYLYIYQGVVISVSYVLLASLIAIGVINARYYLAERGQKALIRAAFGQYLSPKVVADLMRDPEKLALGGEEREMSAFFSDIASFSTFSEAMTPQELVNVLNDYLTEMCNIIAEEDGTVDKFEGDAIIAFWGAPTIQEDHARRACFAAIDQQKRLDELRERWMQEGFPAIHVRMGINSGPMVVGNMGSAQRMDYTVMGDSVNLAARLEGANKAYGSRIMISEMTYASCGDDLDVRVLDTIRVIGKSEPVTVYEVMNRKGQTAGLEADLINQYERAMQLYLQREWEQARAQFKLCTSIDPGDGPSRTFLVRCEQFIENPPPHDWDGVFDLESK